MRGTLRFHNLDLNLLVTLNVLLAEQNVSRAARRLNVSQPAISSALSRLRAYFSDALLVPSSGRRLGLTPFAETLRPDVRDLVLHIETVALVKPGFDPQTAIRTYKFVCSDYVGIVYISEVSRRLARMAPGISLSLLPIGASASEIFNRGDADFMITPELPEYPLAPHPKTPLFQDSYVCIAWKGNNRIGDTLSLEVYLSLSHVVPLFGGPQHYGVVENYLRRKGYKQKIAAGVPNFEMLPHFVIGTDHIATLHRLFAEKLSKDLPIRILTDPLGMEPMVEYLQWHRHRDRDPANVWMRQLLCEVAASIAERRAGSDDHSVKDGSPLRRTTGSLPQRPKDTLLRRSHLQGASSRRRS
jgi:LysR family transcriptional regulator, nod-box dependent transcriptional activator